ncbi:UNVERIFIED_ORG: hypothetical protein GGI66_006203 [Rhizobium esperanzae]
MAKAYFITGGLYLRYDIADDATDPGYPKPLAQGWPGIEQTDFNNGCDCAIDIGNGKVYLFKGENYLRLDHHTNTVDGVVTPIAGAWGGFAEAGFADGIDAAVNWGNGKAYFMKGDSYVRYDIASDTIENGPQPIAGNWPGFAEAGFGDNIEALVNWGNGKVYAFKGGSYIRFDITANTVDDGYPSPVAGNWPGFAEAGFANAVSAAWVKLEGDSPVIPADQAGAGTHVWYWNGNISFDQNIPRSTWFPGTNPQDPFDFGGHGAEIFNFVIHADGSILRGRPQLRAKEGSFSWLNRNPGNLTGVAGGPDFGQYPNKFNWHSFLIFPTWDVGYAAIAPFLRGPKFRDLSIVAAFQKYAPSGDGGNDPIRYANEAAAAAGVSGATLIRDLNDDQMRHVQDKIVEIEGAVPGVSLNRDSAELPAEIRQLLI